jgi:hypothetical protein
VAVPGAEILRQVARGPDRRGPAAVTISACFRRSSSRVSGLSGIEPQIIVGEFIDDGSGTAPNGRRRKRPAVPVSNRAYRTARPDLIVMAVTSRLRPNPEGRQPRRSAARTADPVRSRGQPEDREGPRPDHPGSDPGRRRRRYRMSGVIELGSARCVFVELSATIARLAQE